MRTLYLDVGNTTVTFAEYTDNEWKILSKQAELVLPTDLVKAEPVKIITSSVRKDLVTTLRNKYPDIDFHRLTSNDIPGDHLDYETPKTLGIDRFLVCWGAAHHQDGDVIVVDAGSACTVDFMSKEKVYHGGVILPGLSLLHKTVQDNLPELPEVERTIPSSWPGKSTRNSLKWGINGGFIGAIETFISKMKTISPNAKIWVTGGDGLWITENIRSDSNLTFAPDLIFEGMKRFMESQNS